MTNEQRAREWLVNTVIEGRYGSQDAAIRSLAALLDAVEREAVEREGCYRRLVESCHMLVLNANDTWNYASADCAWIDVDDAPKVVEAMQRWGHDGLLACMAAAMEMDPIPPLRTEKYREAKRWANAQDFDPDPADRERSMEEAYVEHLRREGIIAEPKPRTPKQPSK